MRGLYFPLVLRVALVLATTFFPSSRAEALTLVGQWKPESRIGDARKSQTVGNLQFKAAGSDGLLILDVSNPEQPVQIGSYDDPLGTAEAVVMKGDYALVAYGQRELQIINVADPANPFRANGFYAPNRPGGGYGQPAPEVIASDLLLDGEILYLADGVSGLQVLDMTQPAEPMRVGYLQTSAAALRLSLNKPLITAYGQSQKWDININNPAVPTLVATGEAPAIDPVVMEVASSENFVYVGSDKHGLDVLDITDPTQPKHVAELELIPSIKDIAIDGNTLLLANYSDGAQIVDISNPTQPTIIGNVLTGQNSYGVAIAGDRGYVVARNLHIFDLSVPASPRLLGIYQSTPLAYRVAVAGDFAFLAKFNDGPAEIINVSNPESPVLAGAFPVTAYRIALHDGRAYLAQDSGFSIFDVSNPAAPSLRSDRPIGGTRDVAVQGSLLFYGKSDEGLFVFDVSSPSSPAVLDSHDTDGSSHDVAVSGDTVVVADMTGGLKIFRHNLSGLRLHLLPSSDSRAFNITGGTAGKTYVLEKTEFLSEQTTWTEAGSILLESGSGGIQDATPAKPASFYRLREKVDSTLSPSS